MPKRKKMLVFWGVFSILFILISTTQSEDNFLKEITTCDAYGKPESVALFNIAGKKVAERKYVFDGSYIVSETLIDVSTGEITKTWTFNAKGQRNEPYRFLCLDESGNILKEKDGRPVLVKPFKAIQREESKIRYSDFNPSIRAGKDTTIYPCENCKKETDSLTRFVW